MKPIIDLHQDLMLYVSRPDLYQNTNQTSFDQIKNNNIKITVVSAFPAPENDEFLNPITNILIEKDLIAYNEYVKDHSEFKIIRSENDIDEVLETENVYGLILHIEGLNVFNPKTDWDLLEKWYNLGVRSIGPVWNLSNPFGGGTIEQGGLTDLGKQLIRWCEEKRVIFDFAHMNEETFLDAQKIVTKPVFVSHGNARSICEDIRNYTDDQIKIIAHTGGTIGMFFSKKFISKNDQPTINDVIKHIDHIKNLVGIDYISVGSDFGGIISGFAEGLNSVDDLQNLRKKLSSKGYSEEVLDKIFFTNALRVLKEFFRK